MVSSEHCSRMIPASNKAFVVNNLVSGTGYDLCVLAIQILGGTMILVIGGIIVATLLVFIVILMVRYKVCNHGAPGKMVAAVSNVYSQTTPPAPSRRPGRGPAAGAAQGGGAERAGRLQCQPGASQ
ncbi:Leucine-rich repeat and fibronectin type-III domain-containing protein 2 [Tupaia chinensis]|uniref:Leucine-rich repeat and fibronectin type-III domain-containing protein 2 n=1 Tax=Tupaia chinensis TaxID=246437 RepID=L9KY63_TUPCH|nr:Leucine-rich repeat and fibronectin type-III domain-containing protein 2 [Tupaia chinensis]